MRAHTAHFGAEQPQGPGRDRCVHQAKHDARADQAELRQEQQREGHGDGERAEVVEGQHLRDQLAELPAAAEVRLQDPHHERNL
jgi:hypothetical protein